ncbi:MAG: aspartyl protease family protein [Flavobacteriaceae bacterium]|nr:aspartyl protease family protein [Flavobacteriaceae bacterium]
MRSFVLSILLIICTNGLFGQNFSLPAGKNQETIPFELVNNLVVMPLTLNGKELKFILDTGVSKPILFNVTQQDSVDLKGLKEMQLKGLGDKGLVKAYRSVQNHFQIGAAQNLYQDLYLVIDKELNLSTSLGVEVHGIIGFEIFRDFVVKINYRRKKIKLYKRGVYKKEECRKCTELPLKVYQKKAYVQTKVQTLEAEVSVNLLIDTGSSDAVWLFKNPEKGIEVPEKSFEDFLGRGLGGNIYGERGKYPFLTFNDWQLKEPIISFPKEKYYNFLNTSFGRDGSLGAAVLKRFDVLIDFKAGYMQLRKNNKFKKPFKYNVSGIELKHHGMQYVKELVSRFGSVHRSAARYADGSGQDKVGNGVTINLQSVYTYRLHPAFEIAQVRENSPAFLAGLRQGDVLLRVDGKKTHGYKLQEIMGLINRGEGKKIILLVKRGGQKLKFRFLLNKSL